MHLLAISGSLRDGASNTALLQAAALIAPNGVAIELYTGLAELPPFNPDLDTGDARLLPASVADLRARIGAADGLLISTPEYAHGLPGAFKNALDWLVGSVEFPGKPVAILMASSRATHARTQLLEILSTMSASIVGAACATVEVPRGIASAADLIDDSTIAPALRMAIEAFAAAIAPRAA
jgi:chromate reductase, NAD(P)H dehydrogenase (quinone)